jgi:hypothetical protein
MKKNGIDHFQHGWALLALKFPEFRALSGLNSHVAELCENYSLTLLETDRLRRQGGDDTMLMEYEVLRGELEDEAAYYLAQSKLA